uniref:Late embryogenesis abundant protein LEA-2 subgroup domain-containing protein n=1 Tax=Cucumis melo TaxID=3656 RepID=A0A9I9D561_CUCME
MPRLYPPPPPPPPSPPTSIAPPESSPSSGASLPTARPSPASAAVAQASTPTHASSSREAELASLDQIIVQNRATKPHTPLLNTNHTDSSKYRKPQLLQQARPRQTNPIIWCFAFLCLAFSLLLIFLGIATLVIFLVVRPRNPLFDIPNASLSTIYFDAPEYLNGDFTILANFTNPNHRVDVRYENADIELFFGDRLIATQAIQPFSQRKNEVQNNKIVYNIRGTFRVKASVGIIHYSFWLHSRCQLVMTSPPTGILVARSCKTKR